MKGLGVDAESRPLLPELAAALAGWQRRRRLTDLVPPLLDWCLPRFQAERALLFTDRPDGGYRVWGSRTIDGETVVDAEKSIAHFAVMRAAGSDEPTLFHDTRSDRRFRTEAERDRGVRSRSILLIPLPGTDPRTSIYLDSRFRVIDEPVEDDLEWQTVRDLFALALTQYSDRRDRLAAERKLKRREKSLEARGSVGAKVPRSSRPARPAVDPIDFHGFLTRNAELIESIDELRRLASSDVPVLIEGESGTGKELLARAVHTESGRTGKFVTLHCGTIPETLVEVELFGHLEGAFTGADRAREGLLAHARGGTLFFDAIEEASPALQGALLRVLETGKYRPLSSEEEIDAEVRVMSAVLEAPDGNAREVGDGVGREPELRKDLYFRLAGARVFLPPLRERREDIEPVLARLFARAVGKGTAPRYGQGVTEALIAHDWPGNAREMENLARRLVALGEEELTEVRFREITGVERATPKVEGEMRHVVERAEREVILRALQEAGGNKSVAARLLGWSRRTFYRRMEKHGIPL